ncbi:hypothetical protein AaE_001772, partial [Aphanomyces astaci]
IALLFEKSDALRMFQDWAPPQAPPVTHVVPSSAVATSHADDEHNATQYIHGLITCIYLGFQLGCWTLARARSGSLPPVRRRPTHT